MVRRASRTPLQGAPSRAPPRCMLHHTTLGVAPCSLTGARGRPPRVGGGSFARARSLPPARSFPRGAALAVRPPTRPPPRRARGRPVRLPPTAQRRAHTCHSARRATGGCVQSIIPAGSAVLLKWGRNTLAFFPMRNTYSGVCGPGILTRHWTFDGSEARLILRGSMHTGNISRHRGADTSVRANRLASFSSQWSNGSHAASCMGDET